MAQAPAREANSRADRVRSKLLAQVAKLFDLGVRCVAQPLVECLVKDLAVFSWRNACNETTMVISKDGDSHAPSGMRHPQG